MVSMLFSNEIHGHPNHLPNLPAENPSLSVALEQTMQAKSNW